MSANLETVVILAAGEGTRMKSSRAKVLHQVAGRSLLGHVLTAVSELSPKNIRVVVGSGREAVEAHLQEIAPQVSTVLQEKRGGTGHAVQLALADFKSSGTILVLAGDTPLLTGQSLKQLLEIHRNGGFTASVLTAEHPEPTGYGRIVRADDGSLLRIVEERDADEMEQAIYEVNSGVYAFDAQALASAIGQLKSNNSQRELYLTDVIEILRNQGGSIAAALIEDFVEILGVNDRVQLAESAALLRDRINDGFMREGVTIVDPTTTWIDVTVKIASDVTIYPGCAILGNSKIATGAIIGPRTVLESCEVLADAQIIESNCVEANIGKSATVGPYSYLRKGSVLGTGVKAGAFVEIKNTKVGDGSKIPHLSYVGDATIGEGTNIGAATVFVNYDGVEKHHTIVGNHVRIGSDSMLVAPVTIGDGAYTAAGSVITEDVPPGAMGVARGKQRNVIGWVMRKRSGTQSAKSAAAAEAAARHSDGKKG